MAPVIIGFGVYAFTGQAQVPDPGATATATAVAQDADAEASATRKAEASATAFTRYWDDFDSQIAGTRTEEVLIPTPMPTATPGSQAQRGVFREGAWVRVNAGDGDCLNARNSPSLEAAWVIVNTCLPHGFEGYLQGEAQYGDGHWWWYLAGSGYVAEEYLEYVRDEDIRARRMPELAGRGLIAFTRTTPDYRSEIWVMNADGSDQRQLRAAREDNGGGGIGGLTWSPDGQSLAFSVYRSDGTAEGAWDVHVLPIADPAAERVYPGVVGVSWSPDGQSFGTIAQPQVDQMSGGATGLPAIVDVATGEVRTLAAEPFWQQMPPQFNYDATKLLVTYAQYGENVIDPGPRIEVRDLSGNEIARVEMPGDSYFGKPRWSPVADQIQFHVGRSDGQPQYAVYDLARRDIIAAARVPKASDKIGGKCGGWDMWSATWSRDGGGVLYSFDMGDTGANGIWIWDVASGEQTLVPSISASPASAGPDGYAAFASSGGTNGTIFIASPGGGFPTLLTDGSGPVWSP
jgi:Tol biopolymer transport system component